jgi:hypothetical protein
MNVKTAYLLQGSLETLHFETKEWIDEVKFWIDELTILSDLVDHKIAHNNLEDQIHRDLQLNMNSMLDLMSNGILHTLFGHENFLSSLFSTNENLNENDYREKHKEIALNMIRLKNDIKALKKRVFQFLEQKEFGLRHNFLS